MLKCGYALEQLKILESDSIDTVITDPPYGYSFMNKDWDKAVISSETWKECLRVLKPGAFAAIMSSPRQDVLSRMIVNLQDAGFRTDFTSIYWTYASGFPKAANVSKLVDKRNGKPQREIELEEYLTSKIKERYETHHILAKEIGIAESLIRHWIGKCGDQYLIPTIKQWNILKTKLDIDTRFDELIEWKEAEREIIGQQTKARSEGQHSALPTLGKKTKYIDIDITKSATDKAKELDGSYAGFQPKPAVEIILICMKPLSEKTFVDQALKNGKGITWLDNCRIPFQDEKDIGDTKRFVGVSVKNRVGYAQDKYTKNMVGQEMNVGKGRFPANLLVSDSVLKDHSRFFDLDKWFETTFPFIITPKASSSERGENNKHPTVKPIKLMSYLVTLLTREGETVLDPFCGSGTTLIAAKLLNRKYIGFDLNKDYIEISEKRLEKVN